MENFNKNTKTISKYRIASGLLCLAASGVLFISFASYLSNWKADQSQIGQMLDKSVKSSNVFGKLGDWLGNIFIFKSIGIAAFIITFLLLVLGLVILKKRTTRVIVSSLFSTILLNLEIISYISE